MLKKLTFLFAVILALLPVISQAAIIKTESDSLPGTVNENVYMAAKSIHATSTFQKDLIVAGQEVSIYGAVGDDVLAAAREIVVQGPVGGDLRAAASAISIDSQVKGDAVVAGGQIFTNASSTIGGDVLIAGGRVVVNGTIKGRARIYAQEVVIDGNVSSLMIKAEKVTFGKDSILGEVEYSAPEQAKVEEGARINGPVHFTQTEKKQAEKAPFSPVRITFMFAIFFVSGLLAWKILGNISYGIIEESVYGPQWRFLLGILVLFFAPIAIFVLAFSLAGIFLAAVFGFLYFALLAAAAVFLPILVGTVLHKWITRKPEYIVDWRTILTGSLVLTFLSLVPFIGCLIIILVTILVFGAIIQTGFISLRNSRS